MHYRKRALNIRSNYDIISLSNLRRSPVMLAFIDESGYPRPTDSTKNPILLGVAFMKTT